MSTSREGERSGFEIDVRLPPSTTLEEAEAYFLAAEKVIEDKQEELRLSGWFIFHRATYGEMQGFFNSPRTTDLSPREATDRFIEALPERPGVRLYTGQESEAEDEKGKQTQVIAMYGEDATQLDEVAEDLETVFTGLPGVLGIKSSGDPAPNELALAIDPES